MPKDFACLTVKLLKLTPWTVHCQYMDGHFRNTSNMCTFSLDLKADLGRMSVSIESVEHGQ